MKRGASAPTVHRGADDPSLTSHTGLLLVRELDSKLHLVERLGAVVERVRQCKQRRRGLSGGGLRSGSASVKPLAPRLVLGALRTLPKGHGEVRRVRVEAKEIAQSPRSRRCWTIPKGQLQPALQGLVGHTYAYS